MSKEINLDFTKKVTDTCYQTVLVWCGIHWGRGKTLQEAIDNCKVIHPANKFTAMLFQCNRPIEAWVSDAGGWSVDFEENATFEVIDLGEVCVSFKPETKLYDIWAWLCSELRQTVPTEVAMDFETKTNKMLYKYFPEE